MASNEHATQQDGNGRITMARLGWTLDTLSEDVKDIQSMLKEHIRDQAAWCEAMNARVRTVEDAQARQDEKIKAWAWGQGIFTTIAATLAGVFGKN